MCLKRSTYKAISTKEATEMRTRVGYKVVSVFDDEPGVFFPEYARFGVGSDDERWPGTLGCGKGEKGNVRYRIWEWYKVEHNMFTSPCYDWTVESEQMMMRSESPPQYPAGVCLYKEPPTCGPYLICLYKGAVAEDENTVVAMAIKPVKYIDEPNF